MDAISAQFAVALIRGAPSTAALKAAHCGVPLGVESEASVTRRAVRACQKVLKSLPCLPTLVS